MPPTEPSRATEIQAIRGAYAALNRNDVAGFLQIFDPAIERVEPPGFPSSGTYHGIEAVTAHVTQARAKWAEGACEPQRFVVSGDRIIAIVDVRVRLKDESDFREGQIADGFIFRNGKAIFFGTFGSEREALEWAGLPSGSAD